MYPKLLFLIGAFLIFFNTDVNGQNSTAPDNGDGSSGSPYEIATIENLYWLSQNSTEWDKYYIQTADIDASASSGWDSGAGFTPIGNSSTNFTGEYDGDGYTISGIFINRPATDFQALFGLTYDATIKNLGLVDLDITGEDNIGGLVGQNGDFGGESSVENSYTTGTVNGDDAVGGLVGTNDNGTVSNSFSSSSVSGDETIGGLVGESFGGTTITKSYSTGDVTGDETVGGLVGFNQNGTVSYSYSTGDVTGRESATGYYVGGLIGDNDSFSTITNSYSIGKVTDASFTGGFIGNNGSSTTVSNCYWNTETSGRTTAANGDTDGMTGITTAQMKQQATFSSWDIGGVWGFTENSFPYLIWSNHRIIDFDISGSAGWRMMTLPFDASYSELLESLWTQGYTGADNTSGSSNVLTWDEDGQEFVSVSNADDNPANATGFFVYVYDDDNGDGTSDGFPKSIITNGEVPSSSVAATLSYTDTGSPQDDGWNLVGNPYAETIDWDAGSGWTKTNLTTSIHIWNAADGEYQSWNGTSGTLPEDGLIAPFQGFWVQADGSSPALEMTDDVTSSGGTFYKKELASEINFKLTQKKGLSSKAVVMFDEKAKIDKDPLDAWKLQSLNKQYLSLYTMDTKRHALDINALPTSSESPFEVNLDFMGSNLGGEYTLSWNPQALSSGMEINLKDTHTDRIINLNEAGEYNFEVDGGKAKISKVSKTKGKRLIVSLQSPHHGPVPTVLKTKSSNPRFVLSVNPAGTVDNTVAIPRSMELSQNYPNPFNPETVIRYGVPEQLTVELSVFDILGRKVATLVDEQKSAGRYRVNFDASYYSSGLYVYRLKVGSKVLTKKMMLVK